jgi:hypothetical protein
VNLDALPYTVLLILTEFTVGSLVAALAADARGMVTASFVKLSAVLVVAGAALALLAAFGATGDQFEGYRVDEALFGPARGVLVALLALSIAYALLALANQRPLSMAVGVVTAAVGFAALGVLAYQISAPTWGFAGVFLSLVVGALALGFVNEAMVLGHWYLVQPKLPGRPLEELTFALLAVLVVQAVLVIVNAAVPARHVPDSAAVLAGSLASNPAFWLRIGVGLLFPIALAFMAWRSSTENSMMSATGLLYIAVGAVFTGELLARGLLFVTASPV